jgi:tRNA 2-thiouridine synthesizing protein E
MSPAMRALVKYTEKKLGPEKGRSIYLLNLFPPSPAKVASKIAGLPRPTNCL